MKILSGTLGVIILVLILCFALSNQQSVTVGMWPFAESAQLPLYLVGLLPLIFGLFFGSLCAWLATVPHRFRARRLHKELGALNERINELQKTALVQQASTEPKKTFWRRGL